MAATQSQPSDRTTEEQLVNPDNMKEQQSLSVKNDTPASHTKPSQDSATVANPSKAASQSASFGLAGDVTGYSPHIYAPQPQSFYYRGYENNAGEWDEYPSYINAEGLEITSPGVYNENPLVFHTGYGYNPQMPYGPYSPVTSPLPSMGGDSQLYPPQQYPFSGPPPYYQQVVPHSMPYITSPTPVSQPELTGLVGVDQQGDNLLIGTRPSYPPPSGGSFNGAGFHGNPGNLGFPDWHHGFDGFRSGGIWSDWPKPSDRQRPMTPISPAMSPQSLGPLGSFGPNVPMGSQRQKSSYGFGSGSNMYSHGYMHSGHNQSSSYRAGPVSSLGGMNNQGWLAFDSGTLRGRTGSSALCGCNGNLDILGEQNRGPRASRPKITEEHNSSMGDSKHSKIVTNNMGEAYNRPDFITDYKDAKFFVIKSYSEDNVHKSVKYGVWASTPNGNKKLDAAYREAKEKQEPYPVFLFFSVNASAQFCGVAEMVGAVDFEKSVDYWQQDKWSGQFPVKWHIVKDVPNSQFRHIILENNDNKPVTNSRDTQEVKLEQGIEILNIFKNCETDTSILDDFAFYEEREKVLQERKAKRQPSLTSVGVVRENDCKPSVMASTDLISKMSKSFAQVVRLDEGTKETSLAADRTSSGSDGSAGPRAKNEDATVAAISSGQLD